MGVRPQSPKSRDMYLLRSLSAFLLLLSFFQVEAKLMGKGLGIMYGQGSRRPWERQGEPTHLGGLTWRDEEPTKTFRLQQSGGDGGQRRRPCVGLCYYEKLLALAGKNRADKRPNETIQDDIPPESTAEAEEKPCVGICQYYSSLGIENPYEKRQL